MPVKLKTSKVVFVPLESKKDPEETVLVRLGIRIELSTGEYWFHKFPTRKKPSSWTRHIPGLPVRDWAGGLQYDKRTKELLTGKETTEQYSTVNQIAKDFSHCPELLGSILRGIEQALEEEESKRHSY